MRKIRKTISIAVTVMIIGVFFEAQAAYCSSDFYVRAPLKFSALKFLFRWPFFDIRNRDKTVPAVISFDSALSEKLREINYDKAEVGIPCHELAFNSMMYGRGGNIELYYTEGPRGLDKIEAIYVDMGPGLDNPNELLRKSMAAHDRLRRYSENKKPRPSRPAEEYGFRNIVVFPDEVIIETKGNKWVRAGSEESELKLEISGASNIIKGTKITLTWDMAKQNARHQLASNEIIIREVNRDDEVLIERILGMDADLSGEREVLKKLVAGIKDGAGDLIFIQDAKSPDIAGFILYMLKENAAIDATRLFVRKDLRRKGYGALLLKYCQKRFDRVEFAWVPEDPGNKALDLNMRAMFDAIGFRPEGGNCFVWERAASPLQIARQEGLILQEKTQGIINGIGQSLEKYLSPGADKQDLTALSLEIRMLKTAYNSVIENLNARISEERHPHLKIFLISISNSLSDYMGNELGAMLVDLKQEDKIKEKLGIIKGELAVMQKVITGLVTLSEVRMRYVASLGPFLYIPGFEDAALYPVVISFLKDVAGMTGMDDFIRRNRPPKELFMSM